MSKELPLIDSNALKIAEHFLYAPSAVYFGNSAKIAERNLIANSVLNEYILNKSIMAKLAILNCFGNGIQIGLGGSCLDQLLIEAKREDPGILLKKKGDINRRRIMVPISSDAVFDDGPVLPGHDTIHDPGNIDLRILTENEAVLAEVARLAQKILADAGEVYEVPAAPPKRYNWDATYQAAWNAKAPKDRRTLIYLTSIDDRSLPILRYIFEKDFLGIPHERELTGDMSVAQIMAAFMPTADRYKVTPVELESLNIVCNSVNNARSNERCFNIDALVGQLSMEVPLAMKENLRDFLVKSEPQIMLPSLPEKISISPNALTYYEIGIDTNNIAVMDQWTEVVIRSLRKSLTLGVYEYDEYSIKETKRLMDKMAQKWTSAGNVQKHSDTIIIKNMRELEVCAEFDMLRTKKMIDTLGIKQILDIAWLQYAQVESHSIDLTYMKQLLR